VAEASDVVVVKVADRDRHDVAEIDADVRERILERIPGAGQLELRRTAAPEAVIEGAVPDERAVEPRVQQDEAVLDLEEEARDGLAQEDAPLRLGDQGHRGAPRQVLPAEREGEDPPDAMWHAGSMSSGSGSVKAARPRPHLAGPGRSLGHTVAHALTSRVGAP
jgi:hypothetical protein